MLLATKLGLLVTKIEPYHANVSLTQSNTNYSNSMWYCKECKPSQILKFGCGFYLESIRRYIENVMAHCCGCTDCLQTWKGL